jgi:glycine reductase complex component B subunit alpha and beta
MRLQLDFIEIRDVRFSERTHVENGTLFVDREELRRLLLQDGRLSDVNIELAGPGESCRILRVCDVVEPRAKADPEGTDFPGALGKELIAGQGRTCVLRGCAVVESLCADTVEEGRDPNGEIIDMCGPGAELSPYGRTCNVVVLPSPAKGIKPAEYCVAVKMAGLKTAAYLARAGLGTRPDETRICELPRGGAIEELPAIGYVFQVLAIQHGIILSDPILYGLHMSKMAPTVIHPNEVLDGALLSPFRAWGMETYSIQNHPVIQDLFRRHGRELRFAGVILTIASDNELENERSAVMAANLAKWTLQADGVVLTKAGGGAPEVPMALVAERCEKLGVKTTLGVWHIPVDVTDVKGGITMFNAPELNAVVSMGTPWQSHALPAVKRIIGSTVAGSSADPIDGEVRRELRSIRGAQDQLGSSATTAVLY